MATSLPVETAAVREREVLQGEEEGNILCMCM